MSIRMQIVAIVFLFGMSGCCLGPYGTELVQNGDGEAGSMTAWATEADGMQLAPADQGGFNGLTNPAEIGRYCFTGAGGPEKQVMTQEISLAPYAGWNIDWGKVELNAKALLQTRQSTNDQAILRVYFLDRTGTLLEKHEWIDEDNDDPQDTWHRLDQTVPVPRNTRSIRVEGESNRGFGSSSDGFLDNISLKLSCK